MRSKTFKFFFIVMVLLFAVFKPCGAQPPEAWRVTVDLSLGAYPNLYPAGDEGLRIGADFQGNVYVVMSSRQLLDSASWNPTEFFVFKYDVDGNQVWQIGVGNAVSAGNFMDFHVDANGNVYGVYAHLYAQQDVYTFKINSNGTMGWLNYWNNTVANDTDWPVALDVDTMGNVYVLVNSDFNPDTLYVSFNPVILKYGPGGDLLWEYRDATVANRSPRDIAVDSAGNAFVLFDGALRKYSSTDGTLTASALVQYWWKDDGLPTNPAYWADVEGVGLQIAADGGVYVAGRAQQQHWFWDGSGWRSELHWNFFTAGYDSGCNLMWSDEFGTHEDEDYPKEIGVGGDGSILVSGPSGSQLVTLRYSPSGTRTATHRFSQAESLDFYIAAGFAYVIEENWAAPYLALSKYSLSTALQQWTVGLDDLLTACDIVVGSDDGLYVTGSVHDGATGNPTYAKDMVLIKYNEFYLLWDLDRDGDVDGADLSVLAHGLGVSFTAGDLEDFGGEFGNTNRS